jgi:6-pyruvoyltetrahydropterin/6-carboxytetrahydropterin synthase
MKTGPNFLKRRHSFYESGTLTRNPNMYELKVTTHFSAAHRLRMVGSKCENLHGHNWKIEAYIVGEMLDDAGVLMDFGMIKNQIAEIMALLDHKYLNELDGFKNNQPSSENIAHWVAMELRKRIDNSRVTVSRVTAWESDDACATYIL